MPRKSKKEIIEELDHAFELALILISIISGIIAQYAGTEQQEFLPPIIANMRRLSITFVFPIILTIVAWISTYFIDDENWKMRLRTYAWSSVVFSMLLEIIIFYVVCRPKNYPVWMDFPFALLLFLSQIIPIVPVFLVKNILKRYKTVLKDIKVFAEGKFRTFVNLYVPFLSSWIIFWLAFFWALFV
ncbi:MAG: hypothetical protein OEZ52_16065 [Candidatus Aminicenantes bacterium]|nr:hypothetical protein [Candidatus Aminicenantes bacterium]